MSRVDRAPHPTRSQTEVPVALAEEAWRLDKGASRTSHVRTLEGLADFVSDKYDGPPALRNAVISEVLSSASLRVRETDERFFDRAARGAISAAISGDAISVGGPVELADAAPTSSGRRAAGPRQDDASGMAALEPAVEGPSVSSVSSVSSVGSLRTDDERRGMLNTSQRRAIEAVFSRHLTLVQGPPGTGKTRAACELLRAASRVNDSGRPLLACGPSNAAVRASPQTPSVACMLPDQQAGRRRPHSAGRPRCLSEFGR